MKGIWGRLANSLRGSRFVRGVLVLAGGTALGQLISLSASPIITRLYSPEDFGVLSIYSSVISIGAVIVALRYELAIPLPEDDQIASELFAAASVAVLFITVLSTLGIWAFGDRLISWINTPALEPYLWLLPVGIFAIGINHILLHWALRKRAYGLIARTKLTRNAAAAAAQVGLGLVGARPVGLLIGSLIGLAGGNMTLGKLAVARGEGRVRTVSRDGIVQSARRYSRFPLISSWSSLLNAGGVHSPALLLAGGYGAQVAGLYALAQRMIEAPMRLIGTSVAQVYLGEAAHLVRSSPSQFMELYFRAARRLVLVGALPILAVGMISPWGFELVFGADWREAGEYVQILAPYIAIRFVVYPLSQTLNILERQDIQLYWDVGRFMIVVTSLVIPAQRGWPAKFAIAAFGAGMAMCYIALLILSSREVVRRARVSRQAAGGLKASHFD